MNVCVNVCLVTKSCEVLLQPDGLQSAMFLCPWDVSGKNTGVGCHFLLQGIFPNQGSNPQPALAGGFFTTEYAHICKQERKMLLYTARKELAERVIFQ